MQGIKNVVLVHGAWADGSSWSKLIPLLQAQGLHAVAVQNPLSSLADDVASTNRLINAQDGPVLLVGHSYGGAVITEAGNNPKVAGVGFLVAFFSAEGGRPGGFMWPLSLPTRARRLAEWLSNILLPRPTASFSRSKTAF